MRIEIKNFTRGRIDKEYFKKIGETVLEKLTQPFDSEINLVFVGDSRMKGLNKKYRGMDKTTDVLSFPSFVQESAGRLAAKERTRRSRGATKAGAEKFILPPEENNLLGEIVISVPQARRQCLARRQDCRYAIGLEKHGGQAKKQATKRSYPLKRELTELFVHGILHLIGYDDEMEEGYEKMIKKQDEILSFLNN